MIYGSQEEQLRASQKASGHIFPALANKPEVPPDLAYIWDAFWLLSQSRVQGFAEGPIPLSEVAAYVAMFNVQDVSFFLSCIRELDSKYLEWRRDSAERERERAKAEAKAQAEARARR